MYILYIRIYMYVCGNCIYIFISDVPIFGIGHYRPLFLVSVSVISDRCNRDIVINVPIMSFLVIIASSIAFMILVIIEKMLIFIETRR